MSYIFTLSGQNSVLSTKLYPPIILNDQSQYELGLINFMSYNTIPNVDETNNMFYIDKQKIKIPKGTYEIKDLVEFISQKLEKNQKGLPIHYLSIVINHNTMQCEIKSTGQIDFSQDNSIGKLFGFENRILKPNTKHFSDHPINVTKVNAICVECNLIRNSFNSDKVSHILHMFYPSVAPGYKIIETPTNVIYLPINTQYIDEILIKITDQDGELVNFNKELITVRLHLKQV